MRRRSFLVLAIGGAVGASTLAGCAPSPEPIPAAPAGSAELTSRLNAHLAAATANGFNGSVLIVRAGRVLLDRSYGFADRERRAAVTDATPFWIASLSKTFTAAAILRLAERRQLSLDDPIGRFLPNAPPDKRSITVHQLLTHTSGLADADAADGIEDRDSAAAAILGGALARAPGSAYGYSNDAYVLLAIIVERAAGEAFESFVRRELLVPARLRHTGFWGPGEHPEVAAILPAQWGGPHIFRPNWGYRGARGMFSTAADLNAWYRALAEHRVLSRASAERLFASHVPQGAGGVGYGWFVAQTPNGPRRWARGNQGSGHGSVLAVWPEQRLIVAIVSNTDRYAPGVPMGHRLAAEASDLVLAAARPGD